MGSLGIALVRPSALLSAFKYLNNRSLDFPIFHEGPAHYWNKGDTARFLKRTLFPKNVCHFEVFLPISLNVAIKIF